MTKKPDKKISPEEIADLRKMLNQGTLISNQTPSWTSPPAPPPLLPKMYIGENGKSPAPATPGSAGYDLYAAQDYTIAAEETVMISTEVKMSIPPGLAGFLMSRSGLGVKKGLAVAQGVGLVDSDYRGEIFVPLYNRNKSQRNISKGDAVAQMVFVPYAVIQFTYVDSPDDLDKTDRGEGGFGSSDKKEKKP
jgi:dUTP pyrophosphatase